MPSKQRSDDVAFASLPEEEPDVPVTVEIAPAYVFLASEADASFVSGTVLGVTGGQAVF